MCEMTHISQAVGGFIRGGNAGPRGPADMAAGGNIYRSGRAQGSGACGRGCAPLGGTEETPGSCASADSSRLLRLEGTRGAEEEEGTRR